MNLSTLNREHPFHGVTINVFYPQGNELTNLVTSWHEFCIKATSDDGCNVWLPQHDY